MANARELKERMASIQETRKITNAMYLISSSKVKQARKKLATQSRSFSGSRRRYQESCGMFRICTAISST